MTYAHVHAGNTSAYTCQEVYEIPEIPGAADPSRHSADKPGHVSPRYQIPRA